MKNEAEATKATQETANFIRNASFGV